MLQLFNPPARTRKTQKESENNKSHFAPFCSTQNYQGKITAKKQITNVKFQTVREYYKKLKFSPPRNETKKTS